MFEKDWVKPRWPERLVAEFEAHGKLTRIDVIRVCGGSFFVNPWVMLRAHGFRLEPTGEKAVTKGHPPFYRMLGKPSYMDERVKIMATHIERTLERRAVDSGMEPIR